MYTRRAVLKGAAATGVSTVAGCGGVLGLHGDTAPVTILAAGSLTTALEHGLRPVVDPPIRVGTRGSAAVARLIAAGTRTPDIVSLADPSLFDGPLHPEWYATYATNAMVLAYNPETAGGRAVRDAGPSRWWRPILDGTARFGRTDPDLDPLGYRTLFTLALAADYYPDAPALREQLPARDQVYPETQLLAQFETGGIDAALTYRNMAVERGYDYLALPAQIDLSDPAYADRYGQQSYTLPSGTTVYGDVIRYAATVLEDADRPAVQTVFDAHVEGAYLPQYGFGQPTRYPQYSGDVPTRLRQ
ncbi:MAG: extracellular solute-binding protein [Halobacteriaceae archaeon]